MLRTSRADCLCLAGALVCLLSSAAGRAQDVARHTVEISALGRQTANEVEYVYGPPSGPVRVVHEQLFGGALAGYAFALNRHLALEARAGYLFGRQIQVPQNGGEQFLAHAGVLGSAPLGHSRYTVHARIAPGISSFSSGLRSQDFTLVLLGNSGIYTYSSVAHFGRITHFSLEEGIGISAQLSARTSLHFDVSHEILLQGDRRQTLPGENTPTVVEQSSVEDHALVSIGLRRSFGRRADVLTPHRVDADLPSTAHNELLVSYALQPTVTLSRGDLGLPAGVAFTGSHFFRPWIALDSSIILLGGGDSPTFQDGGAQLQFVSGIKLGLQRRSFGLYAKARPGLISFQKGLQNSVGVPPPNDILEQFGGDLGAVVEVYPAHNLVLRADLGETLLRYAAVTPVSGYGTNYVPGIYASTPQFLLGAGWRF